MFELPPLPATIETLLNPEADRLERVYPDLPRTPDHCVTCAGSGTFRWWDHYAAEPTGEVVDYKCPCIDQWVLYRRLLYCGIQKAYQRLSRHDATHVEAGGLTIYHEYLDLADRYMDAGVGLILHGSSGTGKTMLSALLAKGLVGLGHDVHFTTFAGMLGALRDGWRDQEERLWFAKRIRNSGFLVLDDVGSEHKQRRHIKGEGLVDNTTSLSESSIDELLRHRVASAKPTIITTNLDLDDLKAHYGSNVMSLLSERSVAYAFTGSDFRPSASARVHDEIRQGLTRPVVLS